MKYVILFATFFVQLSYAADYEQELIDYVVSPCLKSRFDVHNDPERQKEIIDKYGDRFYERVKGINEAMNLISVTSTLEERKQLYQMALNDCMIHQEMTELNMQSMTNWIEGLLEKRAKELWLKQYKW